MRAKLSLAALSVFCVAIVAGALAYPGGSWLHPQAVGFSLVENFWCDLMREPAHNGSPNRVAPWLGILGFAALGVALAPFWLEVSRLLPPRRASFVRVAGVVSAVATSLVALFPSDRFPRLHPPLVLTAGILGFICGLACGAFAISRRREQPLFAAASAGLLAAASLNLALYVRAVYFHAAETPLLPFAQKLATLGLLLWMVAGLRASADRPKP